MKTLVTGATGFIGSHLIQTLQAQGHHVIATDHVPEPGWIATGSNLSYRRVDLAQPGDIGALVAETKPDKVIHLAGLLVEPCEADPQFGFQINVMATLALLEACRTQGVGRFVMTSSTSVFGKGLIEPVADDAVKRPTTIYGQTKLACEHALEWYRQQDALSVGAVRFSWVYGPGRVNGITAHFSSFLLDAIARGDDVAVETPDLIGDWLYVDDAVRALCLLLERRTHAQTVYNIAGDVLSVGQVMAIAKEAFPEARITIKETETASYPYASSFDDTLARTELGWQPDFPIRRGVRAHVDRMRASQSTT